MTTGLLLLAALQMATPAVEKTADGGVTADLNPVLWADVPDISICRKDGVYYMTSTTMHFNPGIPVMMSTNLVNWTIASYCYDTVENRDADRLKNGRNDYGHGTWASSIRYNAADGYFYVSSFNVRIDATYLFRTKDPARGGWEFVRIAKKFYDHSLWIEDGRFAFVAAGNNKATLWPMRWTDPARGFAGGLEPDGEGRPLLANIADCVPTGRGLGEGCQLFKKDGWYYLFNICWPKGHCRLVACHRAPSLEGPWEGRTVYECEGIAQGGLIDTPDGRWYAYLFGDRGGVGRIPYLIPITWEDGWPTFPRDAQGAFTRPPLAIPGVVKDAKPGCVEDDEFDGPLKKAWQFNHNPDPAHAGVTGGCYRITTARLDRDLLTARNTLTQRTFGPVCAGMTKLDYADLKPGDVAGLALFQACYGFIGVEMTDKGPELVLWQNGLDASDRRTGHPKGHPRKVLTHPLPPLTSTPNPQLSAPNSQFSTLNSPFSPRAVHLKAVCDFTPWPDPHYTGIPAHEDAARFYWSTDGVTWQPLGDAMYLPYTIGHFTGYRFALFAYATKEAGGHADFDFFRTTADVPARERLTSDGTNPIVKTRFTPDPAAVVDGDWLYVFSGHDEPDARGYTMRDWGVIRTKDLKTWEDLGPVMTPAVFTWALGDNRAWASQAIKRNGKWYWYVAVYGLNPRGDSIGVAVADRPEGPWTDPIGKPLVGPGAGYIDPSVFIDDDGQAYLFWGNCGGDPGCWYAELKDNMVELAGEVKPVPGLMDASAFGAPLKKTRGAGARKPIDTNFEEAPWIYKVGDTYYLEYAAGGVPEHWAYSWSKSIHGPWTYGGKIMDCAEGTGTIHGGSVFFKGNWYMLYHNATLPGGADCRRSACIERYTRNADGSIPFIPATARGVAD